jgi:serine protease Do
VVVARVAPAPAAPAAPRAPAPPAAEAPSADTGAADDASGADENPNSPLVRARDGMVLLERNGKVLGAGSVLAGDGRILTALSILGHGNNIDARFADGSVSQVKMGHTDRAWDIALLVPQNARWKKGLRASRTDPAKAGTNLRAFSLVGNKEFAPARTLLKGKTTLVGGDSELLQDALELVTRFKNTDLGTPIVDDKGDVVAVVARACAPAPNQPCTRVPYGVPVSAIKAFLRTVPAAAVPPAPWLGIQGVAEDVGPARGVRVLSVHSKSPAGAAGLHGGADKNSADTVVAVDGTPVLTPEALGKAINERAVGDSVQLLLFGRGKFRQVTLQLRAAPEGGPAAKSKVSPTPPKTPSAKPKPRPAQGPSSPGY